MGDFLKKVPNIVWTVIVGIGVVAGVWYGVDRFATTFARAEEVVKVEAKVETLGATVDEKVCEAKEEMAKQTVQTFKVYQMKQETSTKALQLQILNIQYEDITDRYYKLRRQVAETPADLELKAEFDEVRRKKVDLEKKRQQIIDQSIPVLPLNPGNESTTGDNL